MLRNKLPVSNGVGGPRLRPRSDSIRFTSRGASRILVAGHVGDYENRGTIPAVEISVDIVRQEYAQARP